jgi:hypothetical protein
MLHYRDFEPERTRGGFLKGDRYEGFDTAVAAANAWIRAEGVRVVNVETVVLPNIHASGEEGTSDAHLRIHQSDIGTTHWHQFVRVWFRPEEPAG